MCFVSGIYIFAANGKTLVAPWAISLAGQEALVLAVNAVLTLCIDGMMLVHSVSLRWALYRDEATWRKACSETKRKKREPQAQTSAQIHSAQLYPAGKALFCSSPKK
jgi:hypothetical protein